MKIAIISSGIVNINTFLKEQIKVLISNYNAKITLITNTNVNANLYKELKSLDIDIINISFERKPNIFVDVFTLINLTLILKKSNFDMTITITPKAGFIGTLASFVCITTGEGLVGASIITCSTRLGATNGIGAWSRTPSCDREFCQSTCM